MAESGIEGLEPFLADFARRIEPRERQRVGLRIAAELRRLHAASIKAQQDPDGEEFAPRKPSTYRAINGRFAAERKKKKIRENKMFLKAASSRFLLAKATPDEASIGFVGSTARIMRVHQEGLTDHVTQEESSPVVRYAMRRVLGWNDDRRGLVLDRLLEHLSG